MKIVLDREKKLILLKALKNGFIEGEEIEPWFDLSEMTVDEINAEIAESRK